MTPPPTTCTRADMCPAYECRRVFWTFALRAPSGQRRPGSCTRSLFSFGPLGRTPMATGLYDPAYEHDACGVGMVADLHGRADHDIVDRASPCSSAWPTGAPRAPRWRRATGPGSWCRSRTASCPRRSADAGFSLPAPAGYAVGPGLPARRRRRRPQGPHRGRAAGRRGGARRAGLACRAHRARGPGEDGAGGHAPDRAALRGADAGGRPRQPTIAPTPWPSSAGPSCCASGPSTPSTASTSRPCRPARSSTRACSPPSSCASSSPTCATRASSPAWPWCTPASRPTPSPAGRWPTRTATWPTTARSTPWPATATGCGPARPCSRRP